MNDRRFRVLTHALAGTLGLLAVIAFVMAGLGVWGIASGDTIAGALVAGFMTLAGIFFVFAVVGFERAAR